MKQFYLLVHIILMQMGSHGLRHMYEHEDGIYFMPYTSRMGLRNHYTSSQELERDEPITGKGNTYDLYSRPFQSTDYEKVNHETADNRKLVREPIWPQSVKSSEEDTERYRPQFPINAVPVNYYSNYYSTRKYPVTQNKEGRFPDEYEPFYLTTPVPVYNFYNQYYTSKSNPVTKFKEERVTDQYFTTAAPLRNFYNEQYATTNYPVTVFKKEPDTYQSTRIKYQEFNTLAAVGKFGLNMLQIANQRNNLVLSPYSVTTLLALLQQGATGETLEQISSALQMPVHVAATASKQITDILRERHSGHNILNVANNIFISAGFNLNPNFENNARVNFGSEVTSLDFFDSLGAAQSINRWVSYATQHKINQLVSPGSVSGNTQLVLVNALLFKGVWQTKFRAEATLPREFYVNGYEKKTIPFMRARRNYKYGEDKTNLQVIVLPFENEEYSLMLILPSRKSSVAEILRNLNYTKLVEYLNVEPRDVDLEIPKFSVRSDTDLRLLLSNMGITKMFGASSELFGIGYSGNNAPQVSSAIHSATLSIDEEGGTASGATAFTIVTLSYGSPDAVFKADRPFLAVLWDTKLTLPLIMAKIDDPTS